jgi:hypothetical protein
MTTFGAGSVVSFHENRQGHHGPKYSIKLTYGTAFLSPSAVLFALPTSDQLYVRRDGVMVRDESLAASGLSALPKVSPRFKLMFATEDVYLFMRLYTLVCALLSSGRLADEASEPPETSYHTPPRKDPEEDAVSVRVKYADVLSALMKVVTRKMDGKDFETLARKLTKKHVHQFAALPKLLERCAQSLLSLAKEDCILPLYDYCKYGNADPVSLRARCLAVTAEVSFRIQMDSESGAVYFNYLPKSTELLTSPAQENDDLEKSEAQDAADVSMEMESSNQEVEDSDNRPNKRLRVD